MIRLSWLGVALVIGTVAAFALVWAGSSIIGASNLNPVAQSNTISPPDAAVPRLAPEPGVDGGLEQVPQVPVEQAPPLEEAPQVGEPGAVAGAGKLIAKDVPQMGAVVTDEQGWTLYRFDKDTPNPAKSNCNGTCEQNWPPVLAQGGIPQLEGIDSSQVSTVKRDDGTEQVTLAGWPLYRFANDPKPGAWKGQAVGGTWWVIAPDGKKNLSCIPKNAPNPGNGNNNPAPEQGGTPPAGGGAGGTGY